MTIVGDGALAYDIAMLVSRALLLTQKMKDLYVVDFTNLLDVNTGVLNEIASGGFPPIMITDFFPDTSVLGADPSAYKRLESIIKKYYLGNMKPIFFHIPVEFNDNTNHLNYGDLIAKNFIEQINTKNFILEAQ